MKVISGYLKGKKIKGYNTVGTRPTMDRIKESLFATIQNYIDGSIILDLFAGSGSLGIEAISNHCKFCYFVDNNKQIIKILKNTLDELKISNAIVYHSDYNNILQLLKNNNIKLDIIFLDPPYKLNVLNGIVDYIVDNNLLNEKGLIVLEHQDNYKLKEYKNLKLYKEKKYSDKFITILQKKY